jgi:tRNA(Ile2) C34 agmatinyltransferase TiaS
MVKVSQSPVQREARTNRCHRCGGLMVPERLFESGSTVGSIDWRCVSCGNRIDPVILAHRQKNFARAEAEKLFSGAGVSHLN